MIVLDFPRPDILKRELSMGKVYAVVLVLPGGALAYSPMPDKTPMQTGVAPANIIGSPSDSK
ncbi:MAG: hypothetical protein CME15_07740 [Gemmatimonadetes bacterium]|jgi:hypothetical protein|nr:hypothetical protein [Gemmatimonadota bacterium]|tara:strand:+ start:122 stop:307 length:186 start_codon:yes stop_codon:yes gene_type:complete